MGRVLPPCPGVAVLTPEPNVPAIPLPGEVPS